jgi:hypothetical protein
MVIAEAALWGCETSLPGFEKFKIKQIPECEGSNQSTGRRSK